VITQFLALVIVVGVLRRMPRQGRRLALPLTLGVSVVIYGAFVAHAALAYREVSGWLAQYPLESLEERLPEPRTGWRSPLSRAADKRLSRLEDRVLETQTSDRPYLRRGALWALHSAWVRRFVNSPGFGVTRMRRLSESDFEHDPARDSAIPQPVPRTEPAESSAAVTPRPLQLLEEAFEGMHLASVADFANPGGFGAVLDRQHVAGFEPHAFSKLPTATAAWQVETIDLIGLLIHEEPVAYVSANLPRMDQLREAATRPLDAFEAAGLKQLQGEEDLVIAEVDSRQRMLGSLRSARQCVQCHGGERGDLLGAFSYTLRKAPGAGRK